MQDIVDRPAASEGLVRAGRIVGEVLAIIRRKEVDLLRYQAGFDACWLLVYGLWQASSFFDFDYLKPHMFTSKFDGVGFVDGEPVGTCRSPSSGTEGPRTSAAES